MAAQSVGLNMTKLVADGVRADVLQALMPRSQNAPTTGQGENIGELIPLNQVITRGEDITGKIQLLREILLIWNCRTCSTNRLQASYCATDMLNKK